MNYLKVIIFLITAISVCSCKKDLCSAPQIVLDYKGFGDSDLINVVVTKYRKNGSFNTVIDSTIYFGQKNLPSGLNYGLL
jgi:hypothetical protein